MHLLDGGQKQNRELAAARLTHLDERGRIRMVDVGEKPVTRREAIARGEVRMAPATLDAIVGGKLKKGEALAAARIAGIMAAKRTHELIPLCHQIALEVVEVDFNPDAANSTLQIQARAVTNARTGVEMEALVAVSAAALTIYDMAKAIDRAMEIGAIRLVAKAAAAAASSFGRRTRAAIGNSRLRGTGGRVTPAPSEKRKVARGALRCSQGRWSMASTAHSQ